MVLRNQLLALDMAHCCRGVAARRQSWGYMDIYIPMAHYVYTDINVCNSHIYIYIYFYINLFNHEFTPVPNSNPIPQSLFQVFFFCIFITLFSDSGKLGSHFPQYIYLLAQSCLCITNFPSCYHPFTKMACFPAQTLIHCGGASLLSQASPM